ncbi:MAG: monovalent cation/H+ antiporter subunit D family protein [Candidatus Hydrothermarchaeales archaeon]
MVAEVVQSIRPALAPLGAIICAFLILLSGEKRKNLREFWTMGAALSIFWVVASLLPPTLQGTIIEYKSNLIRISPMLTLEFRVDALGQFFAFLSSSMWILLAIYTIGYMRSMRERNQTRFYAAFAMSIAAANGIAYAGNMFTLFIFYEMLSISVYPLIIHHETEEAMRAGRKYLMYVLFGGVTVLGAMAMTYVLAGTVTLSQTGILAGTAPVNTLRLLFLVYIMGFGVKSAIMPLHGWLPTSMVAPTPANALLAVVEAGVFGIVRVVYNIFGVDLMRELGLGIILAYVATITILVASIYAFRQNNLKLRLAYSTVSQLSYVVLGVALLSPNGLTGGIIHIVHQAIMKSGLFFIAGAMFVHTGKKNISEMRGLGKRMPITMMTFSICALGVIGFPPLTGFITKWFIAIGSLEAGHPIFVIVILISAFLNAGYYLPIIYNGFFEEPDDGITEYDEAPIRLILPAVVLAIATIALGIFVNVPYTPFRLTHAAVRQFLHMPALF